jgi:hypothetical protein
MKAHYNPIFEAYFESVKELLSLESSIAMEAEETTDATEKRNFGINILKKLEEIIKAIVQLIEDAMAKLKVVFQRFLLSDKGFRNEVRKAETERKPLNGVRIIGYEYNLPFLNNLYIAVMEEVKKMCGTITNTYKIDENSPLNATNDEIQKNLLDGLRINTPEVDSMAKLLTYTKEKFRGTKKEFSVMSPKLGEHLKLTTEYQPMQAKINSDMSNFRLEISKTKSLIQSLANRPDVSDETKQKAIRQTSNLAHLFNFATRFSQLYTELRIEQMLASRVVVKKFYQM